MKLKSLDSYYFHLIALKDKAVVYERKLDINHLFVCSMDPLMTSKIRSAGGRLIISLKSSVKSLNSGLVQGPPRL